MRYQIILKGDDLEHDIERFVAAVEIHGEVYPPDDDVSSIIVDEIQLLENP